jgi:hypothetical protein
MNTKLIATTVLLGLALLHSSSAREIVVNDPSKPHAQVSFQLVRVPTTTAATLEARPEIKTKPQEILANLLSAAESAKPAVAANFTLQVQLGTRAFFDGDSRPLFEAEAFQANDRSVAIHYIVNRFSTRLISSDPIVMPRGSTAYLGRIPLTGVYTDSSELIFLQVE